MKRLSLILLFLCGTVGHADDISDPAGAGTEKSHRFEITPFGGYRSGGSMTLSDTSPYNKLDFDNGGVFGLALGMRVTPPSQKGDAAVEFMWSHQDTTLNAEPNPGSTGESMNLKIDQFLFNGLYMPPGFEKIQPYVLAGLGAARFAPTGDVSSSTYFAWALGGGAKVPLTERLGLRFEAKWDPALADSNNSVFCNSATGQCFVASSGSTISQFDFTAGVTFKL